MIIQINPDIITSEKRIQNLCRIPYYGHSKGCLNYNNKEGCPPQPLVEKVFDFKNPLYIIYTIFHLCEFAERMRTAHPEWNEHPRQWYNPRRWQPAAKKEHRLELERFVNEYDLNYNKCPEAHGVNVTDLMAKIGVEIPWYDWPPDHILEDEQYLDNVSFIVSLGGQSIDVKFLNISSV